MQFLVPKFIERETKLVGPLTFKQLLYIVGEGVFVFAFYFILPRTIFWIVLAVALVASAAFVFLKPGGQPLSAIIKNLGKFIITPKRYIWQKKTVNPSLDIIIQKTAPVVRKKQKALLKIAPMSRLTMLETKIETRKL